jgi:hypothetical protein
MWAFVMRGGGNRVFVVECGQTTTAAPRADALLRERRASAAWAAGVAERVIRRFAHELPGWRSDCESMKHLKLVVVAELVREVRSLTESIPWRFR